MEYFQKKGSNKVWFHFLDDMLKYSIQDSNGKATFSIEYGSIPVDDFFEIEEKTAWYRNLGVVWIALGTFFTVARFMDEGRLQISIWIYIGLICLGLYKFSRVSFTAIDVDKGRIFVVKDGKHDEILREIDKRRKTQWVDLYGKFNYENEPEVELRKFKFLYENEAITEHEFNDAVKRIYDFHGMNQSGQDTPTVN